MTQKQIPRRMEELAKQISDASQVLNQIMDEWNRTQPITIGSDIDKRFDEAREHLEQLERIFTDLVKWC